MQTWYYRLPSAVRALTTGALSAAAIFGVMSLYAVTEPWGNTGQSVIVRLVVSAVAGMISGVLGVVLGDQRTRRIYGSTERAITYLRALRTGRLPADIDPGTWRRWLDAGRQSLKWAPAAVGVFALLAVLQSLDRQWAVMSLFALLAIWQLMVILVQRRRISRLSAAIDRRLSVNGVASD
jgi:hypothetical protein